MKGKLAGRGREFRIYDFFIIQDTKIDSAAKN